MRINIISFVTVILLTLSCKAQTPIINQSTYHPDQGQDGMYLKDINNILDRFVGTWKWEEGNSSFEIIFVIEEMVHNIPGKYYSDKIVGKYKYIENGVLITDNLSQNYQGYGHPINGSFNQDSYNHLDVGFIDSVNNRGGSGYFELIEGTNPQQAKWWVSVRGKGIRLPSDPPINPNVSLPFNTEIILVKQ